jgi:hypothetical protein
MRNPRMSPLWRRSLARAVALALVATAATSRAEAGTDDFSSMPTGACLEDGTAIGSWSFVYDGYGCTAFMAINGNTVLVEQPQSAADPYETHAGLALGSATSGDVIVQADMATTRQLRIGTAPNPWEVAWLLWRFTDNQHFYYFIPKPNGWELGKADPAYPGAQRFLATGSSPQFPLGAWYRVRVTHSGNTMQVFVNGVLITTVTDTESPYSSGRVGLYTEDAESYFDNVSISGANKGKKPR